VHLGRPLRSFETLDSTSDELWRWAAEGAPHGACVRAEEQSAGRGRQGRAWHSPAASGIYFSVLLRPTGSLREWSSFSLAVGNGVARGLAEVFALRAQLKWPNDLISGGRKLGGILCETRAAVPGALAVGIGLNLVAPPSGWPDGLRGSATSIAEEIAASDMAVAHVDELFVASLTQLERAYHLFAAKRLGPFLDELRDRDALSGHRVRFQGADGTTKEGRALRIEADGTMLIEADGRENRLIAGEVHLLAEQS
jgi:BirA family biotin operon repressor/biotin-[acetyl-CoA-carboxylase] ligase